MEKDNKKIQNELKEQKLKDQNIKEDKKTNKYIFQD